MMRTNLLVSIAFGAALLGGCDGGTDDKTDKSDTNTTDTVEESDSDTQVTTPTDSDIIEPTDATDSDVDSDTDELIIIPGDLLITEVGSHPTDPSLKWIEITNPGPGPVSLEYWQIEIQPAGVSCVGGCPIVDLDHTAVLEAGESWLLGNDAATQGKYSAVFQQGCSPDQFSNVIGGDGDDPYFLTYRNIVVDIYGEDGINGAGQPWDYTEAVATRNDNAIVPSTTWNAADWTLSLDPVADASLCGFALPPDTDEDTDNGTFETDDTFVEAHTDDTFDTTPLDTDSTDVVAVVGELQAGDLVITEFMAASGACTDDRGEYVAFSVFPFSFSALPTYIDLQGLTITTASGGTFTVSQSTLVVPGDEVVAWVDGGAPGHCYFPSSFGVPYTGLALNEAGDSITLSGPSIVIDTVDFTGMTITPGIAKELSGTVINVSTATANIANDDITNWCDASLLITAGLADRGSPAQGNDNCPVIDTDIDTDITDDTEIEDTEVIDTDIPPTPVNDATVGDLIITEFLANPGTPCLDVNGEYIEVYNASDVVFDLTGMTFSAGANTSTVASGLVEPQDVIILHKLPDTNVCFTNFSTGIYTVSSYNASWTMVDGGDIISIGNASGVLDTVDFRPWAPTASFSGSAWSLDEGAVSPVANDQKSNWCLDGYPTGSGNIGSAGSILACQAIDTDTDQ